MTTRKCFFRRIIRSNLDICGSPVFVSRFSRESVMSLQWVAVAGFLYVEIGFTLLLILPLLKPSLWKKLFSMRIFSAIQPVWSTVFYATLLILVVLFVDSLRTMYKYSDDLEATHLTLDAKLDRHLRECKGQRNYYITFFSLFLILVIRRLITMVSKRATLEASHEATLRQGQSANQELQRRLDQEDGGDKTKKQTKGPSQEEFDSIKEELKKAKVDLQAIKKQAESTNTEYDRLAADNQKLQDQLKEASGDTEEKKDQ